MANDFNLSGTKCISCPYEARLTELSIIHERTVTELKTYIEQLENKLESYEQEMNEKAIRLLPKY